MLYVRVLCDRTEKIPGPKPPDANEFFKPPDANEFFGLMLERKLPKQVASIDSHRRIQADKLKNPNYGRKTGRNLAGEHAPSLWPGQRATLLGFVNGQDITADTIPDVMLVGTL